MSDLIIFNCPFCHQELDAPEEYGGEDALCPACQKGVVIPAMYNGPSEEQNRIVEPPEGQETAPVQDEVETKSSTIRIDVGDEMVLPQPKPRVFKIKRPGSS